MDDMDARIDALYAGPPGEFTAARDALARELRALGQREDADRVRTMRRPSRLAAELNHLVREDPARVATLIRAEEELEEVQGRVVAGEADAVALRAAEAAEAAALDAFPGGPGVHAALRFAARSTRRREDLRAGRLTVDPAPEQGETGLFALGPPAAAPAARPAPPPVDEVAGARTARAARRAADDGRGETARRAQEEQVRAAIDALEEARRGEREAAEARDAARRRAEEAEAEGARLAAERDSLRAGLDAVETSITAHQPLAREAADALAEAESAAKRAARERDGAERAARRLTEGGSG